MPPKPDTAAKKPEAPEGYFLIPRLLAFALTGLAFYIAIALTVLAIGVWSGLGTDSKQKDQLAELAVQTRRVTLQNRRALCGLRKDLHERVVGTAKFLKEHPEGLPQLEVSPQTLREGIRNQRRTIHALGVLDCIPFVAGEAGSGS